MTICQYFLQGRCRFGQNCRFEHSTHNDDRNNRNFLNSQQLSTLVKKVAEIVMSAEEGHQWPLSCFAPLKDGANIPGWEDYSPEEIRWKMYEARSNGTLNQVTHEVNQLYRNAEKMRNILKEPTMERVNIIANLIKGKSETPNVTNNPFKSLNSSSNIFGGSVQSTNTQNIFGGASSSGSQGSIFGGSGNTSGSQGSIFGGSSPTKENIFGNAVSFSNNSIFGNSVPSNVFPSHGSFQPSMGSIPFSQTGTGSENIFGGSSMSSQNIFSNPNNANNQNVFLSQANSGVFSNSASIFEPKTPDNGYQTKSFGFQAGQSDNIFKSPQPFNSGNIFGSQSQLTNSAFGSVTPNNSVVIDLSVYSKVEDLNEDEMKSFTSPTFAFGKIPLKPPPQMYCK